MTESKRFQRTREDFDCSKCGARVTGDGYTNHCPQCLWSRHVDNNPGDRASPCRGMMEPVSVLSKGGEYVLLHRCGTCGFERNARTRPEDNFEAVLALARQGPKPRVR